MARKAIAEKSTRPADRSAAGTEMGSDATIVWIVGQVDRADDQRWQFAGVFSSELQAVSACRDETYFIGPAILGRAWPHYRCQWPGAYYPHTTPVSRVQRGDAPTPAEIAIRAVLAKSESADQVGTFLRVETCENIPCVGEMVRYAAVIQSSRPLDRYTLEQVLRTGAERRKALVEQAGKKSL